MMFLLSSLVKLSLSWSSLWFLKTCVMVYNKLRITRKLMESARLTASFRQALVAATVSLKTRFGLF